MGKHTAEISENDSRPDKKMMKIIAVLALCLAVAFAKEGDSCHDDSHCGKEECCSPLMVSRRAAEGKAAIQGIPGICHVPQAEGNRCNHFSQCACQQGLSCMQDTSEGAQNNWEFGMNSVCQQPPMAS